MIIKFVIGTCILMNNHLYRIEKIQNNSYLLRQTVTVFEEDREFRELWKISYVDKVSEKVYDLTLKCKDN